MRVTTKVTPEGIASLIVGRLAVALLVLGVVHRGVPILVAAAFLTVTVGFAELLVGAGLYRVRQFLRIPEDEVAENEWYTESLAALRKVVDREVWPPERREEVLAAVPATASPRVQFETLSRTVADDIPREGIGMPMQAALALHAHLVAWKAKCAEAVAANSAVALDAAQREMDQVDRILANIEEYRAAHGWKEST